MAEMIVRNKDKKDAVPVKKAAETAKRAEPAAKKAAETAKKAEPGGSAFFEDPVSIRRCRRR